MYLIVFKRNYTISDTENRLRNKTSRHSIAYWEKRAISIGDGRKSLPANLNDFIRTWTQRILINNTELRDKFILDAGCGSGFHTVFFQKYTDKVIGTDVSLNFVKICKSNGIMCVRSSVTHLPFKENSFDITFCNAVLQHIIDLEERKEGLLELVRVTLKGGRVILGEENKTILHKIFPGKIGYIKLLNYRRYQEYVRKIEKVEIERIFFDTVSTCLAVAYRLVKSEKFCRYLSDRFSKRIPESLAFGVLFFIFKKNFQEDNRKNGVHGN